MNKKRLPLLVSSLALIAPLVGCLSNDDDLNAKNQHKINIQVGPRPYFIVEDMSESALKEALQQCADGPFVRTDFTVGHRGAAMHFPEHTKESYQAAYRMGAGVIECDVAITADGELVCRHSQCDLHNSTNILETELAAKCAVPFTPASADGSTEAEVACCTTDITLDEYLSLRGKVDAGNKAGSTVSEYMNGTPNWRTDLYSTTTTGTLMSHKDSIQLFAEMGVKMTPELKSPTVTGPLPEGITQQDYAQKLVDEYREAGIEPEQVWLQSFRYDDVLYWLENAPEFAAGVVYLHSDLEVLTTYNNYNYWRAFFDGVKADGVNTVAPPITALLTHDGQKIIATQYAYAAREAGLDIVAWTLENTGPLKENDNFYLSSIREVLQNDGDAMVILDVLAQDIGVKAVFTDWAGTATYYASCMGLK